jgi:hypothetical protein
MTEIERTLRELLDAISAECRRNPEFSERIARALRLEDDRDVGDPAEARPRVRRAGRRPAGVFDPFDVYADGEENLRHRLQELNEDQLKDIIAEHSMDTARRAMKWKDVERLATHIVTTVVQRARKGGAFLARELRIRANEGRFIKDWSAVTVPVEVANRGPADTVSSIELRLGESVILSSMPNDGQEVDRLIELPPLRLATNDGRIGVLFFAISPEVAAVGLRESGDAELIVRCGSGSLYRCDLDIRGLPHVRALATEERGV